MTHPNFRSILAPAAAVLLAGCVWEWPDPWQEGYTCAEPSDCTADLECADGVCVRQRIQVKEVRPHDGASDVHPAESLWIVFTKSVILESAHKEGEFALRRADSEDQVPVEISQPFDAPEFIHIRPLHDLDPNALYVARLGGRVSGHLGDTLGDHHEWTFRVADAGWQPAEIVSHSGEDISVGAIPGHRKVVWVQETNSLGFSDWLGHEWSPPGRLDRPNAVSSPSVGGGLCLDDKPCLAWAENGLWLGSRGGPEWDELRIDDDAEASNPMLVVMPNGRSFVTYRNGGGVALFDSNGPVTQQLPDSDAADPTPRIDAGVVGHPVVVWKSDAGVHVWNQSEYTVFQGPVESDSVNVAAAPNGRALVYWRGGTTSDLFATSYPSTEPAPLTVEGGVTDASCDIGERGGVLLWTTTDKRVVAGNVPPAQSWTSGQPNLGHVESLHQSFTGPMVSHPRVAVDDRGNAVALWLENGNALYARRRLFEGSWGPVHRLDVHLPEADPITELQLTLDVAGRGVAIWNEAGKIWAARFE